MHHVVYFLEYIIVASFKCIAQLFSEILVILCFGTILQQFMTSSVIWLHNTKSWISLKREQILKQGKHHLSSFWKAFYISVSCFSFRRDFKKKIGVADRVKRGMMLATWQSSILTPSPTHPPFRAFVRHTKLDGYCLPQNSRDSRPFPGWIWKSVI